MGPAVKGSTLTADQINDLLTNGNDAKKVPHNEDSSGGLGLSMQRRLQTT